MPVDKKLDDNAPVLPAGETDAPAGEADAPAEPPSSTEQGSGGAPTDVYMEILRGNVTASGKYIRLAQIPERVGVRNEKIKKIVVFRETEFDEGILRVRTDRVWLASKNTDAVQLEIPLHALRDAEANGKKELVIKYLADIKTGKPCTPDDITARHIAEIDAEMQRIDEQWVGVPDEAKEKNNEFEMAKRQYDTLNKERSKWENSGQAKSLVENNTKTAALKLHRPSQPASILPPQAATSKVTHAPAWGEHNKEPWNRSAKDEYKAWAGIIDTLIHSRDKIGYLPGIVITTIPNNCSVAWNLYEDPDDRGNMISDAYFDSRTTPNTYDKPMSGLAMNRGYHELWILHENSKVKVIKVPLKGIDKYDRISMEVGGQSPGCAAILAGMKYHNEKMPPKWEEAASAAVSGDVVSATDTTEPAPNPDDDVRGVIASHDCCIISLPNGFFIGEADGRTMSGTDRFVPYNMVRKVEYTKGRFEKSGRIRMVYVIYDREKENNVTIEFGAGGKSSITPEEYEMWRPVLMSAYDARQWDPIPDHKKINQARGPVDADGANITDDGTGLPPAHGSPEWYDITRHDIENNFERFEPFDFERLVTRLFEARGYNSITTPERGDFGVDVLVEYAGKKIAIQVKKYQGNVGGPDVNKTLGAMIVFGASQSIVITTGGFTQQCYDIQKRGHSIELWDGERTRREFAKTFLHGKYSKN